ncbi:MAG: HD domain-containing protein [Gemmataceae bacterium]|nr:HD domain-containing protein [Gemmataceae bacterium]
MTMSAFRQPEFLTKADHPKHRIRCPIHGFIRFSENERLLIDHPLFRRLRWIRQLALTELVYPGATHTRFEHSLGVMEVATRIFDALARTRGDVMERTFATVERLRDCPLAKARLIVRLAAMLHDVGHCCFSHAAEEVIQKDSDHESLTVRVLTEDAFLGGELRRLFFEGCADLTANLIKPSKDFPPQLQVLRDIVSGQVDADRTDYLLRDSHHCGVDYGLFDYRRMIECLTLREDPEGLGGLEIAIQRDGIHTFEALILARYQMNTQVYYHRLRRIYDLYLKEYFRERGVADFNTPEKVLQHNDMTAMTEVIRDAGRTGEACQPWAERIRDRRHHRLVYESDEDAGAAEIRKVKGVFDRIRGEYQDVDFRWDLADVSIHKLLLPEDKDSSGYVQFSVIDTDGRADLLGERSPILRKIPRWFQVARIFADVGRDRKPLQREIAGKCKTYAKA